MIEEWRDIAGYEGYYRVSNKGEVMSIARRCMHTRGYEFILKEKILKVGYTKKGYVTVTLYKEGTRKTIKVHRLVASAFIPNKLGKPQVNHINAKKDDNKVSNLEWCTNSENQIHAVANKLTSYRKGEMHHATTLNQYNVYTIAFLLKHTNMKLKEIGSIFNVTDHSICAIKRGRNWKHLKLFSPRFSREN